MAARARTLWRCQDCGYAAPRWLGRCPECGEFETLVEEVEERATAGGAVRVDPPTPVALSEVDVDGARRVPTGIGEFDRVLGGGLVAGSLVLIGGEPGIGKSTLLTQAARSLAAQGAKVLYVCGEESPAQVRLRADRLGGEAGGEVSLLAEVDVSAAAASAEQGGFDVLVVDSIQTMLDPELAGAPGSVGQVRASTTRLMRLAKDRGVTVLIVGHVTKEGSIAGPRVLEHMVDTVLYFEGDRDHLFRIVRAVKNRFGSVSEIGVFEMGGGGLTPVASPSEALLSQRPTGVAGSVVMPTMEGSRPLLVEIQALVTESYLETPRRLATGVDRSRVLQVIAVLERRGGVSLGRHDVYVSVAGGVRVTEPAADLPLALALASAHADTVPDAHAVAFGELGLAGEVRAVPHARARLAEAARMGFMRALIGGAREGDRADGIAAHTVSDLRGALGVFG